MAAHRPGTVQWPEPVLEPRGQLGDREVTNPGGGEFDRQRQPVEPLADAGDQRGVGIGQHRGRRRGPGPVEEQTGRARVVRWQRGQLVDRLVRRAHWRPGRRQDRQRAGQHEQLAHHLADRIAHPVAVVDDEQVRAAFERHCARREQIGVAGAARQADRAGHGGGHLVRRDVLQIGHHRHSCIGGGEFQREARLAAARRPDDGHPPRAVQQRPDRVDVITPAHERVLRHVDHGRSARPGQGDQLRAAVGVELAA